MENSDQTQNPRVFISYSWTTKKHKKWVLDLASRLVQDGVDVVLDKWDLKEGYDKFAFMERMVTDESVSKVILICDKGYKEKADKRSGGVGTESQIISRDIYEKVDQDKFIPVLSELDVEGNPYLPTFVKTRIYIDLSSTEADYENYDQLLRSIYGQPLHRKPALGKPPKRIFEQSVVHSDTLRLLHAFEEAVHQERSTFVPLASDYLDHFLKRFDEFRITTPEDKETPFDEKVVQSLKDFLPYRDEFVEFVFFVAKYKNEKGLYELIHEFLEKAAQYTYRPSSIMRWADHWADNFGIIIYELFLYLIASLLKCKRYAEVDLFLSRPYYVKILDHGKGQYKGFDEFYTYPYSLEKQRKARLKLNRISLLADTLRERATNPEIAFEDLMFADFVLLLRAMIDKEGGLRWFPNTMIFSGGQGTFDFFGRAASKREFQKVKVLLKVESKEDLVERLRAGMKRLKVDTWRELRFTGGFFNELLNLDELDTLE